MATPPVRLSDVDDLLTQARAITDFDTTVLSDDKFKEVVATAEADIMAEVGDETLTFYGNMDAERALLWATCLFAKVKAGELDGVAMSLGDIDLDSRPMEGEYGSGPVMWLKNAQKYLNRLAVTQSDTARFGSTRVDRGESRKYGSERDTSGTFG